MTAGENMQPKQSAPGTRRFGIAGVATPPTPWQAACFQTLKREFGAAVDFIPVTGALDGGELDLVLLFTDGGPLPQPLPPSRGGAWTVLYGFSTGLHRHATEVAADLLAHRTTAEVHVVRLDAQARPERSLYSSTTRVWPWAPQRSVRHLQEHACRCLCAAISRQGHSLEHLDERSLPALVREPQSGPLWGQSLLLAAASKLYLVHAYGRLLFRREHWAIGIVDAPIADLAQGNCATPVRWLPNPDRFTYRADPMSSEVDGEPYLLAEQFNGWNSKGIIVASRLAADGAPTGWQTLLEAPAHLSYPFLYRDQGKTWLTPEAWESWRVERRPISHNKESLVAGPGETLLARSPGIEPTLFQHDNTWWLFCGNRFDGPDEKLFLWFSDHAAGPWVPHPWNPVVMDIRHARPAGPVLQIGTNLIRPAQDCSKTYGGAVVFLRIDHLSRTAYHETPIHRLAPDQDGPWPHGLHTIGPLCQRTVIDGKRWIISPLNPLLKLVSFLRNHRRRAKASRQARTSKRKRLVS